MPHLTEDRIQLTKSVQIEVELMKLPNYVPDFVGSEICYAKAGNLFCQPHKH